MEDIILDDAVSLTNKIELLAKSGPITNIYDIISVAILNSLWTLVAGTRCNIKIAYNITRAIDFIKNNLLHIIRRFDLEKKNPQLMETLSVINDIVRSTNITGGILTHLPFLRYISPRWSGFTALNQSQTRVFQFFKVILYVY